MVSDMLDRVTSVGRKWVCCIGLRVASGCTSSAGSCEMLRVVLERAGELKRRGIAYERAETRAKAADEN